MGVRKYDAEMSIRGAMVSSVFSVLMQVATVYVLMVYSGATFREEFWHAITTEAQKISLDHEPPLPCPYLRGGAPDRRRRDVAMDT